jgi:hypothetical protein
MSRLYSFGVPILSQMNPIHMLLLSFLQGYIFFFCLLQRLPGGRFPCRLPNKIFPSSFSACYMSLPSHVPLFDHSSNILWRVEIMKLPIIQFSPASCYFLLRTGVSFNLVLQVTQAAGRNKLAKWSEQPGSSEKTNLEDARNNRQLVYKKLWKQEVWIEIRITWSERGCLLQRISYIKIYSYIYKWRLWILPPSEIWRCIELHHRFGGTCCFCFQERAVGSF